MQEGPDSGLAAEYERLVASVQAGEGGALAELYRVFGPGVRFYLNHRLRREDVDDKVHDVFIMVITAIQAGQLRAPERLPGFIRTIAQRQVAHSAAESGRLRMLSLETMVAEPEEPLLDPEQEAIGRQRRQLIERIFKVLPEVDRQILRRYYFDGQEPEQICQELKITENQFRVRKHRAKQRFTELTREAMKGKKGVAEFLLRKKATSGH